MPSYTALQLCNRVRLKARGGAAFGNLDSTEGRTILACVNEAMTYVLETRDWDFDHRHDGVLQTRAVVDSGTVALVAESATVGTSVSDVFTPGDYVARLLIAGDTNLSSTAVKILNYEATSGLLDAEWIGDTDAAAEYQIVFYEYKLPDYVKDVTAVRYQDQDMTLRIVGWDQGFRSAIPRPTDRIEDNPEIVVVGAQVMPTLLTSDTATGPGLGLAIYPCPLGRYRLEYSYKYRHPQLVEDDDELEHVSDAAVHDIVLNAFALMEASTGRDPNLAEANRMIAEMRTNRHHEMNRADASRRKILRSMDDRGGEGASMPSDPRVFHEP